MMGVQTNAGWADRLGTTARVAFIVVVSILALFALGMVVGFSYGVFENGRLPTKPLTYLKFAAMLGLLAIGGWVLASLIRSIRPETLSGFDRRYWKMWAKVVGLSIPLGIIVAVLGLADKSVGFSLVVSNAPITALSAILVSIGAGIVLIAATVIYFRAIDDHEQQAYLWGSNVAFHFLALSFPLYWLLARGGIVPQITIGIVLLLVLLSCAVQAIVWALFKFR